MYSQQYEDKLFLLVSKLVEGGTHNLMLIIGAMAHPIRPDSYIKIDNFYTITVYRKGAAIIRMFAALLGKDGFRYVAQPPNIHDTEISVHLLAAEQCSAPDTIQIGWQFLRAHV